MSNSRRPWVPLGSDALTAQIDPLGAQLSVLRDRNDHDLLWGGDAAVWAGRAPLLFPIVGALAGGVYRLGAKTYPLARHGFARVSDFQIVESKADSAVLRLESDETSLRLYPFLFELEVRFAIEDATLSMQATVRNHDHKVMPASFGFHPAFRWPLPFGQPRSSHYIEFPSEEPAPVRRLDDGGLLTPEGRPTPVLQRRLILADGLFDSDAVIFDELRSRYVTYGASHGPRMRVDFPDSPYLGIWTKPQAGFICIEPWHGVADPQGFAGDFSSKPGVFRLAAGAHKTLRMSMTLLS